MADQSMEELIYDVDFGRKFLDTIPADAKDWKSKC